MVLIEGIRRFKERRRVKGRVKLSSEIARLKVKRAEEERGASLRLQAQRERRLIAQARGTGRRPSALAEGLRAIGRVGARAAPSMATRRRRKPRMVQDDLQLRIGRL